MLPSTVSILGQTFKVVPLPADADETLYGEMKGEDETIFINVSHPLSTQRRTLFHECIHAAFYVSGWSQVFSHNREEAIVRLIENSLWPLVSTVFLPPQ